MSKTSAELISVFQTFDEEGDVPIDAMVHGIPPGDTSEFIRFIESKPIEKAAFFMSFCAHLGNGCKKWLINHRNHELNEVSFWCSAGLIGTDYQNEGLESLLMLSERAYESKDHQQLYDIVELLFENELMESGRKVCRLALEVTPKESSNYNSLVNILST